MVDRLDFFISAWERFLSHADRTIPIAVETRNGNYLKAKYFSFLSANDLFPVFSQKIYMPDISSVWPLAKPYAPRKAVIRLLGDDRNEIEKASGERWDSIVSEKPEKSAIASTIIEMLDSGMEIFLNINNHYEGSSILTAEFFGRESV